MHFFVGWCQVAFQIAKAIAKNTSIQHLLLHDNAFSAKGMDALLKALGCNLSIIELTIGAVRSSSSTVQWIGGGTLTLSNIPGAEGQSAEPKEEKRLLRHLKNVLASTREFQKVRVPFEVLESTTQLSRHSFSLARRRAVEHRPV